MYDTNFSLDDLFGASLMATVFLLLIIHDKNTSLYCIVGAPFAGAAFHLKCSILLTRMDFVKISFKMNFCELLN
jgi:hypothetical protein